MTRTERLQEWINTLDVIQMSRILLDLTEYAIDSEEVSFWDNNIKPYWSHSGDNLDGTDRESDDEDEIDTPF